MGDNKRMWVCCMLGWVIVQPANMAIGNWKGIGYSFLGMAALLTILSIIAWRHDKKRSQ